MTQSLFPSDMTAYTFVDFPDSGFRFHTKSIALVILKAINICPSFFKVENWLAVRSDP